MARMTTEERRAQDDRMARARAEAVAVVASGRCPKCGGGLRRNMALTGWWPAIRFGGVPGGQWQAGVFLAGVHRVTTRNIAG